MFGQFPGIQPRHVGIGHAQSAEIGLQRFKSIRIHIVRHQNSRVLHPLSDVRTFSPGRSG